MADTPVEVMLGLTGRSGLILKLYPRGSDELANTGGDALSEQTNRVGCYRATVTESLVGLYEAYVFDGATLLYTGAVDLEDGTSVHTVGELGDAAISSRAKSSTFNGITSLANWLGVLAGAGTDDETLLEIQATPGGADFDNEVASLDALYNLLNGLPSSLLDEETVETGITVRMAARAIAAALAGWIQVNNKNVTVKAIGGGESGTTRITAESIRGSRSAVVLSLGD